MLEKLNREALAATSLKLPIFQPTAAAAMMQIHAVSMAKQKRLETEQRARTDSSNSSLNDMGNYTSVSMNHDDVNFDNGTVSVNLLAQVLKKDSDNNSKKSLKFFPYICLRCKKELVMCDSPTQTDENDFTDPENRVVCGNSHSFTLFPSHLVSEQMTRSKTVGSKLFEISDREMQNNQSNQLTVRNNSHQKCSSVDWSAMNAASQASTKSSSNNGSRNRLNHNAWSDIQHI
jgi:hypothetical protein